MKNRAGHDHFPHFVWLIWKLGVKARKSILQDSNGPFHNISRPDVASVELHFLRPDRVPNRRKDIPVLNGDKTHIKLTHWSQ